FLLCFGDPLKDEKAKRAIQELKQTQLVQEYANGFRLLMEDLRWDEKALMDKLKSGIKLDARQEIRKPSLHQEGPQNLEELNGQANQVGDILRQEKSLGHAQVSASKATRARGFKQWKQGKL
ncbi:hypothetical protein FRC11_003196, partial [Ceratobasidium sp. 423]